MSGMGKTCQSGFGAHLFPAPPAVPLAWGACIRSLWQMTHPVHLQTLVYQGHHSRSSPPTTLATTMDIPWSRAHTMVRQRAQFRNISVASCSRHTCCYHPYVDGLMQSQNVIPHSRTEPALLHKLKAGPAPSRLPAPCLRACRLGAPAPSRTLQQHGAPASQPEAAVRGQQCVSEGVRGAGRHPGQAAPRHHGCLRPLGEELPTRSGAGCWHQGRPHGAPGCTRTGWAALQA